MEISKFALAKADKAVHNYYINMKLHEYTINLVSEKPLEGFLEICREASGKQQTSIASALRSLDRDTGVALGYSHISNFGKISTLTDPGVRTLRTVIEISRILRIRLYIISTVGAGRTRLK